MKMPNNDDMLFNGAMIGFPLSMFSICVTVAFLSVLGLPGWVIVPFCLFAMYLSSVFGLVLSACFHIHAERIDYSIERPRLDDYRKDYDHDWGKYNLAVAEYEATRKYAPIEKMSRDDVIKLMITLTFWPIFVLKYIFTWFLSLFTPIIKTFTYIIGETHEGDSDAEDRTVSDSSQ